MYLPCTDFFDEKLSTGSKLAAALNWALYMKQGKRPQFLKPEVGVPVLVQCKDFRFLGYLDAEGQWRDFQTSEIITGVTGWSAV